MKEYSPVDLSLNYTHLLPYLIISKMYFNFKIVKMLRYEKSDVINSKTRFHF